MGKNLGKVEAKHRECMNGDKNSRNILLGRGLFS